MPHAQQGGDRDATASRYFAEVKPRRPLFIVNEQWPRAGVFAAGMSPDSFCVYLAAVYKKIDDSTLP